LYCVRGRTVRRVDSPVAMESGTLLTTVGRAEGTVAWGSRSFRIDFSITCNVAPGTLSAGISTTNEPRTGMSGANWNPVRSTSSRPLRLEPR
jgi:hypothetical protein